MADRNNKKKKKKSSPVFIILILVCIGVMAFSGYKLFTIWNNYRAGQKEYEGLRQYTAEIVGADTAEAESADGESLTAEPVPPIEVDFKDLQAINEDVVGWLYIGSLDISYPIMQGEDNDFYLHKSIEKEYLYAGSIFIDYHNSRDFSDYNTIVYGHNMKDQSMFGKLKLLKEQELYKEDPYVWILTPDHNYRYKMFSMFTTGATSDVYTLFYGYNEDFTSYVQQMCEQSEVALEQPTVSEECRMITLSTCTSDGSNRFVVQAMRES